jgi:hypothetical protein
MKGLTALMGLLVGVLLLGRPLPSMADSSQCGFISDSDQRAYCRATSGKGSSSQCGFIRDKDLRSLCRAETGRGVAQCGFIGDADKRALCRAKARS